MNLAFSSSFKRSCKRFPKKIQDKLDACILLFQDNEFDPILNNHKLHGEYGGSRSINVTSDVRAIYEKISENDYYFYAIGTHSDLYS
ncbi:MAG: type II toxin-antitoxin system mRNA interferase toxin, RelE/StbE family [Patescibacteria group bacterium]